MDDSGQGVDIAVEIFCEYIGHALELLRHELIRDRLADTAGAALTRPGRH